ncbi:guanylate kinase [Chengkuizengella marina]|uniref:Guanylate kinase n=1 Tax=Chengkuizengella marina TaxID=2507566 RepID=A0A6N9Q7Z0_9BACL|nr:hypothetical protein [Chengkuizengella marina]NBI30978.1 hypothetical protein [Chengkuizengella marina]
MGKLFVISGNSGAGKTTIMRECMGNQKEIVSVTTRPPRENEIDGIDYYFLTQKQFEELYKNNDLAEYNEYEGHGYNYGVTKEELNEKLDAYNCYVIADYNGMQQFKELYEDCVTIFIYTSKEDAILNMISREDKLHQVEKRIGTYENELENKKCYDYAIRNDRGRMKKTLKDVESILVNLV